MQLDWWSSTWSCTEWGWLHGGAWMCHLLPSLQPQLPLLALLSGLVLFLGFLALPITFNVSQVSFDTGHSCTGYSYRRISTTSFYLCRQFIRLCLKRPRDWTPRYLGFTRRWDHLWNWVRKLGMFCLENKETPTNSTWSNNPNSSAPHKSLVYWYITLSNLGCSEPCCALLWLFSVGIQCCCCLACSHLPLISVLLQRICWLQFAWDMALWNSRFSIA